jgi:aspartyl aminopeptidase
MENEKPKRLTKFKFLFTKCFPSKLPKYSECEHHMVSFHEKNFAMQSAKEFLKFVDSSPSPFHAVEQSIKKLIAQGYTEIQEQDKWQLKNSGKYFFTRNRSAVVAFNVGKEYKQGNGFAILGAHTDSPCLKVKPKSKKDKFGYKQVGVELYGGGLWHTWFDRDLGLAGRVLVEKNGVFEHSLVNIVSITFDESKRKT